VFIMLAHGVFDLIDEISEGPNLGKVEVHERRLREI
jgi:hypothetical protein